MTAQEDTHPNQETVGGDIPQDGGRQFCVNNIMI